MSADEVDFSWTTEGPESAPTLALIGALDLAAAADLGPPLAAMVATAKTITVDLSALEFIDSSGLKLLLVAQRDANANRCELSYRRPHPTVRRLLAITGTDGFFTFTDD